MTGADSPVMALSSTDATPSMMSPSAGITSPAATRTTSPFRNAAAGTVSNPPRGNSRERECLRPGLAKRVRLRLASPLGHRLGEVGEQDGEPQPGGNLKLEAEATGSADGVLDQAPGRQDASDLDDEHHRIAGHRARVQLAHRIAGRAADDRGIPNRRFVCVRRH